MSASPLNRGWHHRRYSCVALTLRYDFALSRNAFILYRIEIDSNSHRPEHKGFIIASYSYRSNVKGQHYRIYSLLLVEKMLLKVNVN
jgi:hypothetical protein